MHNRGAAMNISVIGTGYVGLITGTCLADVGHVVKCVDVRAEVVEQINAGRPTIYEPGLADLLCEVVSTGNLSATTEARDAILATEVTLICVGTPNTSEGMDLSQIIAAAQEIGAALADKRSYHTVAVKSTVLPGTTEGIIKTTIESHSGRNLDDGWGLCMNPEFLREGQAVEDFRVPDRIVIGVLDPKAAEPLQRLYTNFQCPTLLTTFRTAEMIKYVSNSLLATMISFSNEIANLCAALPGVDARQVWRGVHLDRRLTPVGTQWGGLAGITEYLWHGLGFGGSCFPKDVAALQGFGKQLGEHTRMLDAVRQINSDQPSRIIALLEREMEIPRRRVAVLGLAFKPGTSDVRASPAFPVVEALQKKNAQVVVHDPIAMSQAQECGDFGDVIFARNWEDALRDADACCLITAWPEYRGIQPLDFRKLMRRPLVIDGRGIYEPDPLADAGVTWRGIGYTPLCVLLFIVYRFVSFLEPLVPLPSYV
jgi:UDPglucose 6-dehydrogenase